ncbi:hypothetical protein [Absidia glauca]|uniref:CRAL/TRIO N-terminal domain-containing protein n=1 Tax=Absidia glauca TaxID=4829 RepID=A0A163JHI9_ABSGL|nr:hypothetical protein [Absidia glauca]
MFRFKANANNKTMDTKSKGATTENKSDEPTTSQPIFAPPHHYQPVSAAALSDDQQEKLDRLQEHMNTMLLPPTHEYFDNEKRFLTAGTLNRYMRARKWDYEAARTMLENTVKWRREYRPDQLDPEYIKPEACSKRKGVKILETSRFRTWR